MRGANVRRTGTAVASGCTWFMCCLDGGFRDRELAVLMHRLRPSCWKAPAASDALRRVRRRGFRRQMS